MSAADSEPDAGASDGQVTVLVTRTGGFAGLRREWRAQPTEGDVPQWIALIRSCPWDDVGSAAPASHTPPRGADRFVWSIRAQCGPDERAAELTDDDVSGPWRDLVDRVRDAARA